MHFAQKRRFKQRFGCFKQLFSVSNNQKRSFWLFETTIFKNREYKIGEKVLEN